MSLVDPIRSAASPGVPFSQEDLARVFDLKTVQRGRTLILGGAVRLGAADDRIEATVSDLGRDLMVTVTPVDRGRRVMFERSCTCGRNACAHMAAAAMSALDTRPHWRRASLLDLMDKPQPEPPPRRQPVLALAPAPKPEPRPEPPPRLAARWTLEAGRDDIALFVTATLSAGSGPETPATPRDVVEKVARDLDGDADRAIARLLGGGGVVRTPVAKGRRDDIDRLIRRLLGSGRLRWHTGAALKEGPSKALRAFRDPKSGKLRPAGVPESGALLRGLGWWLVDPAAGLVCPVDMQVVEPPKPKPVLPPPTIPLPKARPEPQPARAAETAAIVERAPVVIARLGRVVSPTDGLVDVLRLSFDYGEPGLPAEIDPDDQRQFARTEEAGAVTFVRRDKGVEQAALERLAALGFAQARIEPPKGSLQARGTRVHWLTGRDAAQRWQEILANHVPTLRAEGWTVEIGSDFGTRVVEPGGAVDVAVRDAGDGWFDLEVGVDIDGERRPLLPILAKLIDKGGMEAARVIDGRAHIVLDDGSVLVLPADRVERLLSVLEAMLEGAKRVDDTLRVPLAEADTLIDIDDLIARRPDQGAQIAAYLDRLRDTAVLPEVAVPASFRAELRDYQQQGVAWLQSLRAGGVGGILADDMGLGKTAQTLAHVAVEHAAGRLTDPCLVVVPTSLVPNWVDEAKRFTPHLKVLVLHGLDRHEKRGDVEHAHIVVTTYGVVARDVDLMKGLAWHLLVLDEAQAIKNPDSKATRAVCQLQARHRLCLSGTPVENNLGELWSQFAFLMPGLLGDRKSFQKRFRTPIEKRGDATRAALLWRRTKPFLLRRTKAAVAKELPPKTEVVRRIDLGREQRDLYETIRLSVHDKVRAAIAASGLSRNAITVIDALLKLRQVCCDPRLVKAASGSKIRSAKLETLVDMLAEMVPEGRRVLVFSQFTSMLDLIKAELEEAGIAYVELTGRTLDRADPVRRFQAGEVPVFLISLKAGGRGLNLTAADTVIHYDPWWNPAAEDQATDRAYRIGQDKPVFVYKLIAANSVEERILDLQRRKGSLSAATIEGTGGLVGALEGGDIDYLFEKSEEA
ncbi:DEAD/DEAH box helicase [Azospirillum sp. TSO22-1]|uniref:DEAD/DEAH box helicase n=1 Tax=Azospirillum sp. TSO22-1 TaxID=716789 RepID=UPI000D6076CA|nr:DEAD/DEAH box helicase [Azospirillum sp. TSO22-1]PWC35318.1 RNA helicase [Azospirillum sp. TSO22-1]